MKSSLVQQSCPKGNNLPFLAAGASVSQAFAFSEVTETMRTEIVQQTGTITGKIIDSNGEAIIGASVVVKGTSNGTITDIDGNFTLTVPVKSILTVSYVGYETVYVPVDGKNIQYNFKGRY